MVTGSRSFVAAIVAGALAIAAPSLSYADPPRCQTQVVRQLLRFKKVLLRLHERCLDNENLLRIPGPCPDAAALLKVQKINGKVVTSIAATCTMADLAALGFRSDCAYETATGGAEQTCAALPVTTPSEFAECLKCWKGAELREFIAILYASHALEECGGTLDESSPTCSDLDCATPLLDQRNLGDTSEGDCQRGIGKAGVKYLLNREKILEKCVLRGGTRASCLADLSVEAALEKQEAVKQLVIQKKCGQRDPAPSLPFCCRTGQGNECTAVPATREDCVAGGGTVQEGKTCNTGNNSCDPVGGPNQKITWWSNCPESDTCPGPVLSTRDDLVACVDSAADQIVDELLCLQFPLGWPCPTETP